MLNWTRQFAGGFQVELPARLHLHHINSAANKSSKFGIQRWQNELIDNHHVLVKAQKCLQPGKSKIPLLQVSPVYF